MVWKTTRHYIYIMRTETCIIHEVLKYLCSDNANFMAIFSHYIPGRVIIKAALFSRLYSILKKSCHIYRYSKLMMATNLFQLHGPTIIIMYLIYQVAIQK